MGKCFQQAYLEAKFPEVMNENLCLLTDDHEYAG